MCEAGGAGGRSRRLKAGGATQPSQRHLAGFGGRFGTQLAVGAPDGLACAHAPMWRLFPEPNRSGKCRSSLCVLKTNHILGQ